MSVKRGISEIYVDLILTMILLSISGVIISSFNNLSSSLAETGDSSDVILEPPLILLIKRKGKQYLIMVNNDEGPREFILIVNGVKKATYVLNASDVRILELNDVSSNDEVYVVASNYMVSPKVIELR